MSDEKSRLAKYINHLSAEIEGAEMYLKFAKRDGHENLAVLALHLKNTTQILLAESAKLLAEDT